MQIQTLYSISTIILFVSITFCAREDGQFLNCTSLFSCRGTIRRIGYPFWGGDQPQECGLPGFELRCPRENYTTIDIGGQAFLVLDINNHNNSMRIARIDLLDDFCPDMFEDTWLNENADELFRYTPNVENLYLFYACSSFNISARNSHIVDESFLRVQVPNVTGCELNISIPALKSALKEFKRNDTATTLGEVLNQGFEVEHQIDGTTCRACESSGGLCWSGTNSSAQHTCLCPDGGPHQIQKGKMRHNERVAAAAVSAFIMCIIFLVYHHRYKKRYVSSSLVSRGSSSYPSLTKDLEKAGVHIFDYHELEEATDHFDPKMELGDGGYGVVYKVKRLYENHHRRVEQFMNEVEILTRLRHQNLVSLYGCTSRYCRELLLVYEYIPNGTLADHLHGPRAKPGSLSWITRLNIAIETASALAYLHASDVIHRDIKSTNLLLDNIFIVKVADFGLSRLLPTDVTHVSTAPQGTPGYVDPEYNEFYQLTEKSDVYSFGVVLIELISSKPAVDITRHRHEINLSTMAINKIQNHAFHDLVDPHVGFDSDYKVRTMIIAVAELAFQCLQNGKDMRPHMQDVLNVLQEIQSKDYSTDVMDIPADDILLLKSNSLPLSPNSIETDC
ncbi:hypothetical protein Pfo_020530 [Paulownia fortunei]|nr:hypothetical protein Pfo_020530 [Paulownia fortunei]